jgi:Spy/CpxP family protein refolding chaperone
MTTARVSLKSLVAAGLLATIGIAASAQSAAPTTTDGKPAHHAMHQRDPAKMQAFIAKRQAALKAKLAITPEQESAWQAFTASMQPPARTGTRMSREDFAKLTTPERIDQMRAHRAERQAAMDQRAEATKTFYAALTPDQQKVFDANTMRPRHGSGPRAHG